jgi:LytS/YehU family sensor histidine kinase
VPQPFYSAWWFYLSLLVGVLVVAGLIYSGYVLRLKREQRLKMEYEQQIRQLQDQSVHAAMNPQFIMNSLNAIQQQINAGKTSDAGSNLSRFARLLRLNMQSTREDFVPLQQELERVRLYLETEKIRMGEKLHYHVDVDQSIYPDEVLVPSLIIQPFVENSIMHGIQSMENGYVKIIVTADGSQLIIVIDDNGIGFNSGNSESKNQYGRMQSGIPLLRQRLDLLRNKTGKEMSLTIRDKEGKPDQGTIVTILLPMIQS